MQTPNREARQSQSKQSLIKGVLARNNLVFLPCFANWLKKDLTKTLFFSRKIVLAWKWSSWKRFKKTKFFIAGKTWLKNIALLKGTEKVKRKTKYFGGKIVLRKKFCAFEWCLVLAGKIAHFAMDFSHHKSKYIFYFWLHSDQTRRIFFFSATLHSQNLVKEIAHILTSFQAPFESAISF